MNRASRKPRNVIPFPVERLHQKPQRCPAEPIPYRTIPFTPKLQELMTAEYGAILRLLSELEEWKATPRHLLKTARRIEGLNTEIAEYVIRLLEERGK
ncbi:MAG: hypothetical protein AB1646_11785 [Thermodesulfobacteriota bacterium]